MAKEKTDREVEVEDTKRDVRKYALLEAVGNSEGGRYFISLLQKDTVNAMDKIAATYKTASDSELRTWCAVLGERLSLLRLFMRAPKNRAGAVAFLDELLKNVDAENEDNG